MRYLGGKSKIAKDIVAVMLDFINKKKIYIEPFCGSCKVTEEVIKKCNKDVKVEAYDINEYLIELYKNIQKGGAPPQSITKEEYDFLKNNPDENKAKTAFAGFGCSGGGKGFGGYAKCNRNEDFAKETYNSLMKQKEHLQNVNFECKDYRTLNITNAVIYCDPPYKDTTTYKIVGRFNSEEFWNKVDELSENNIVFISEYTAPDNYFAIWEKEIKTELRNNKNRREDRVEKLFVNNKYKYLGGEKNAKKI